MLYIKEKTLDNMAIYLTFMLFWLHFIFTNGSICPYKPNPAKNISDIGMTPLNALQDPDFWDHFEERIRSLSWKCEFPPKILTDSMHVDSLLYQDPSIFRMRRKGVALLAEDDELWIQILLGACHELAWGHLGPYSKQLKSLHMLDTLEDYVEHLNCFNTVAMVMALEGLQVKPISQFSSQVHDIDKLDPIMLVGYSERFEDQVSTSIWQRCVDRHTKINPHHQAHCMWQECPPSCIAQCETLRPTALREMVCDKVSRRLQKNLNGTLSKEMWDVDLLYFDGLPKKWIKRAEDIMQSMKQSWT